MPLDHTITPIAIKRGLSERVYSTLHHAIISKELASGERLVEAKVAEALNVSITPVRQAFTQLANEGLLTVYPFKGTYVTTVTRQYVQDVMLVRIRLESLAAELCFSHMSDEDCDTLRSYTELSEKHFEGNNLIDAIDYDIRFHTYLYEKSNNELLLQMWNMLKSRVQFILSFNKPTSLPPGHMVERHSKIVENLRKRDKDGFIRSVVNHIETSRNFLTFSEDGSAVR